MHFVEQFGYFLYLIYYYNGAAVCHLELLPKHRRLTPKSLI